jgi:hypothetical protein
MSLLREGRRGRMRSKTQRPASAPSGNLPRLQVRCLSAVQAWQPKSRYSHAWATWHSRCCPFRVDVTWPRADQDTDLNVGGHGVNATWIPVGSAVAIILNRRTHWEASSEYYAAVVSHPRDRLGNDRANTVPRLAGARRLRKRLRASGWWSGRAIGYQRFRYEPEHQRPTRSSRSPYRRSERNLSSRGSSLSQTIQCDRSASARSSQTSARSFSPRPVWRRATP